MKKVNEIKENIFSRFKGMTFKSYIKETLEFFNTNLKKTFVVLLIVSILLIAMGVSSAVSILQSVENSDTTLKGLSFGESYVTGLQVIGIVIFAGIVPYMYVPIIGGLAGAYAELLTLAQLIVTKGYAKALLLYTVPMLLNIVIVITAVSLGIYICKSITLGYKLDNMKHMNSTNFKLELYKLTKKDKKHKELEKKKNMKIKELEAKHKRIDYFNLFNLILILCSMQLIASLFKSLVI